MRNHPDLPADAPEWVREADIEFPVWRGGVWRDGVWRGGVWRGGVWRGGEWHDGVWHDGEWHGGVWRGGEWRGGVWHDGEWHGGVWRGGVWHGGVWRDGVWNGGVWHDGVWHDGEWHGGVWRGGVWHGGVWNGGVWLAKEDRLLYMAAMLGIVFDESGMARAYRTTSAGGRGRWSRDFVQSPGSFVIANAAPAGSGTCRPGLHVTSAPIAHTYFGIDYTAQMWAVDFHRNDLLDCDGQKARIRAGRAMPIDNPFLPKESK